MTDNEIIKRLEWCIKIGYRNYYDTDIALDLFYQRHEDGERLKHEREVLIENIHCYAYKNQ